MINQKEITIDWINKVSKENKNADKDFVEGFDCLLKKKMS